MTTANEYKLYNESTAPEGARETLQQAKAKYGFLPNLLGVMAESPSLLKGYLALGDLFDKTSFSNAERQVILLAVSRENKCHYCVAAHSAVAEMTKVPAKVIEALREGHPIPDAKLEALKTFVVKVVSSRGWPAEEDIRAFLDAGYTRRHIFEVILGVGYKTLSNYTNHLAETPLDRPFQAKEWKKAS
ncbi:MAG: carboxymuconolactone decarboxylase family protein [Acidobacteria bacterium]|nr:carboxymuconolactone decarboxylase family protein [Acidobacteriota bacterium]